MKDYPSIRDEPPLVIEREHEVLIITRYYFASIQRDWHTIAANRAAKRYADEHKLSILGKWDRQFDQKGERCQERVYYMQERVLPDDPLLTKKIGAAVGPHAKRVTG